MLKRQIAIGDIHGCFELLKELVENVIVFSPAEDMLIFLGDYIDRQNKSRETVEYIKSLKNRHRDRIILLKGNHEDLAFNALTKPEQEDDMTLWMINGGSATLASYGGIEQAQETLTPFIESLELFHETATHIFVHGGIPSEKNLKTATPEELLWDRSFTYSGEKTLVVGHTPRMEVTRISNRNTICVDTGAFMTGVLSAYDVLKDRIYRAAEE
jgi:serine/threonine protein phosphatase 1